MKQLFTFFLSIGIMSLSVSCHKSVPADLSQVSLLPLPVKVEARGSSFGLDAQTGIYILEEDAQLENIARQLAAEIAVSTGLDLAIEEVVELPSKGIVLKLDEQALPESPEGYVIQIGEKQITISANQPAGVFYASKTLCQALEQVQTEAQNAEWIVASGIIEDFPEYSYRGSMLDVSRHFFQVEDVKRYIDLMADIKLNTLHLHLSDDQGWRIEIKSWPQLTAIGGSTQVGGGKGGFYTQEQYKELVQYAKEQYITVVPEIDMPGHTNAALASYAELNCDSKARELYEGIEVGFSTLCTSKEITYQFVDDVVREIAAITEGPYFHMGGDESHVTKKEDYIYFVNRVQQIVKKYGKIMIGWDEVAHADIEPGIIVQFWNKDKNALLGIEKGAKVLMSPAKQTYLDMQYDSTTHLGLHWVGYIEVDKAYNWDPATLVPGIEREHILGVESPLWSETILTIDDIEYMAFPRLAGHAEIGWTPANKRDWEDYKIRLAKYGKRMEDKGVDFYKSSLILW
jgi:hexosaminidase